MAGDGLRRPINAPPGVQPVPGVQPGSSGLVRAHVVIVSGSKGGVFVYSGAPGPGALIGTVTGSSGVDAYGNVYQQGITSYLTSTIWAQLNGAQLDFSGGSSVLGTSLGDLVLQAAAGGSVNFGSPVGAGGVGTGLIPSEPGATGTFESWHAVSLTGAPPGTAGTARVKALAENNMACFDIEVTFTTLTAQATFTIGALPAPPSGSYYPLVNRQYAAGIGGTATGAPQARLLIPASGDVQLVDVPDGASAFSCTVMYPLD